MPACTCSFRRSSIVKYLAHEKEPGKASDLSLAVVEGRLRRFFSPVLTASVQLSPEHGEDLYRDLCTRTGRHGTPVSVQEHHHCLSRAKAMGTWLVKEKLWKENVLAHIEPVGRPKAGEESKPQLNRDALRKLVYTALDLGERGDAGAAAALCASVLGLRASTIANRRREHLDDGGRILKATAKGKTVELSLVGETPAQERVMARLPAVLAGALAHSEAVQEQHYATARSIAASRQTRVLDDLGVEEAGK